MQIESVESWGGGFGERRMWQKSLVFWGFIVKWVVSGGRRRILCFFVGKKRKVDRGDFFESFFWVPFWKVSPLVILKCNRPHLTTRYIHCFDDIS